ncbi:hypothetical protein PIB30_059337 [Stylosanthes scabra]|uniref:Uncharacterized protein n=1 Tax=Stylosanthes scabra TaxID=79078 RepID=A0ABU6SL28_9FABA|nr:hypothetical protein [Stylosanthes scabra]
MDYKMLLGKHPGETKKSIGEFLKNLETKGKKAEDRELSQKITNLNVRMARSWMQGEDKGNDKELMVMERRAEKRLAVPATIRELKNITKKFKLFLFFLMETRSSKAKCTKFSKVLGFKDVFCIEPRKLKWKANLVYGDPKPYKRKKQWEEMARGIGDLYRSRLLLEDFNDILNQEEKGEQLFYSAREIAATEQPKEGTADEAQKEAATAPEKTEEKPQDHKETTTTGN